MLDFWATWCGPCQCRLRSFHTFAEKNADTAVFGKVNVDEQMELAREFEVASIPTILVIKNGEVAYRAVGLQTEDETAEKHLHRKNTLEKKLLSGVMPDSFSLYTI